MDVAATGAELHRHKWRLRSPDRLPNLKGAWLTAYTIIWAIMLPLCLAGAALGTYGAVTTPSTWWPYGIATSEDTRGIRVDAVLSPAVRKLGVKAGDYVIALDDWQVPRTNPRSAARAHAVKPDGSATTFTFRRGGGALYARRLIRSHKVEEDVYRAAGINPIAAVALARAKILVIAVNLWAAILLFVRRRREAVPALLSLAFLMFAALENDPSLAGVSELLISTVNTLAACLLFVALFAFPAGRFEPRWTVVPPLLLPILAVTWTHFGPSTPSAIVALGFLSTALAALVARFRKLDPGAERQQLRWAFFGLAVGLSLALFEVSIILVEVPWQADDPRWAVRGRLSADFVDALVGCALTLGLIVSILRYRLYDADKVIGRSAAYGVLTLGFVALFAGAENFAQMAGEQYFGSSLGIASGVIGAAIAAAVVVPLHNRVHAWAERHFQKELFRLRHGLPPLVGDLRETAGLESIVAATLDSLIEGVHASRAALVVGDRLADAREIAADEAEAWLGNWSPPPHHRFDVVKSDPIFPVRLPLEAEGHGCVGWLLLGPRPDGSLFGRAERAAIEEIADPVARAITVVSKREKRDADYIQNFADITRRVTAVDRRITKIEESLAHLRARRGDLPA